MDKELLEQLNIRRTTAVISPYVDENEFNFNLEKQGLVIFPNSSHLCYISSRIVGNKEVFITGLDESDPELMKLSYEERMDKIRKIRMVVRAIERYHYNNVDVDDDDFWFKVKYSRPDNQETWGNISLELKNEPLFLDLLTYDGFIRYWIASAGGFSEVAPSYESVINGDKRYRYYLRDVERISHVMVGNIVSFNRAISLLDSMYSNPRNHIRLFFLSKYLTTEGYSMSMVNYNKDLCMIALDKFIKGKDPVVKRQDLAIREFMDLAERSNDYLYVANVVKGLIQIGRIKFVDKTGNYFCIDNNINVGKSITDIIEYYMIYDNFDYLNTLCSMYGSQFGMIPYDRRVNAGLSNPDSTDSSEDSKSEVADEEKANTVVKKQVAKNSSAKSKQGVAGSDNSKNKGGIDPKVIENSIL